MVAPKAALSRGLLGLFPCKIFKFRVLEMPFTAFSAGPFQRINTQENAEVSCLFLPISSVVGKGKVFTGKNSM